MKKVLFEWGKKINKRHLVENKREMQHVLKTNFLFAYLHKMNSRGAPADVA